MDNDVFAFATNETKAGAFCVLFVTTSIFIFTRSMWFLLRDDAINATINRTHTSRGTFVTSDLRHKQLVMCGGEGGGNCMCNFPHRYVPRISPSGKSCDVQVHSNTRRAAKGKQEG